MKLLLFTLAVCAWAQAPQNPSPMTESTRPHSRIAEHEVSGQRVPLSLGSLLLPEHPQAVMPLVIHFHGAPWLAEDAVRKRARNAAVIGIQIGSGSGVYARAFQEPGRMAALVAEARAAAKAEFCPIYLTSFSAGYGAIREVLRDPKSSGVVEGILLMDSLHSGYTTGTTPGPVEPEPLAPFVEFARAAVAGRKRMVVTHSEVFPGTFASTTETADYLLSRLGLKHLPKLKEGPDGMQQLSRVHAGRFDLFGFAGNSAPDHVDHLNSMEEWLRLFRWNPCAVPRPAARR